MQGQYPGGRRTPPMQRPVAMSGAPQMYGGGQQYRPPMVQQGGAMPQQRQYAQQRPATVDANSSFDGESQNGDSPPKTATMPSYKVHGIASDILILEQRCTRLEERNQWLTGKLLSAQRKFIEKSVLSSGKMKLQSTFEGWRGLMSELRLERHLHEQTRSLDQCQQVAHELGQALSQEQSARGETEQAHNSTQKELQQVIEQEQQLQGELGAGARYLEHLEKRIHEAENALVRFRAEAQSVVDTANLYERQVRELEAENRQSGDKRPENPLEHSIKLREQAHGTMQKVTALLHQPRSATPERT